MTNLGHVRWIGGGTGAGKSTVARLLAQRYDAVVYDGDRAEHDWVRRCSAQSQPYFHAGLGLSREERALRAPGEAFRNMASLHGETIGFVIADLLALPDDRPILVDWFGNTPRDVRSLLRTPAHAVFLLPTAEFRREALGDRYADPQRARANWGDCDHARAFENRLGRDALWDAELRRQAAETGLPTLTVDGARTPEEIAEELAGEFRLAG